MGKVSPYVFTSWKASVPIRECNLSGDCDNRYRVKVRVSYCCKQVHDSGPDVAITTAGLPVDLATPERKIQHPVHDVPVCALCRCGKFTVDREVRASGYSCDYINAMIFKGLMIICAPVIFISGSFTV
jgi:hypothetical protein